MHYVGRFAPSPTGPLHMGSLVTALASWVDAQSHGGTWLLRIEDIDPPREVEGATEAILTSLRAHGLHWHGDVSYQSKHSDRYDMALAQLRAQDRLYACQCTRKQLRANASITGHHAYPGHCRHLQLEELSRPLRFRLGQETIRFTDLHAGLQTEKPAATVGDFVVRRKDKLYAYQLAVVVDDAAQNITHIVRGADLLDNSARQIALQQALGYQSPFYLHLPLVMTRDGKRKLSKQTGADGLNNHMALENLRAAWRMLGQTNLTEDSNVTSFLANAVRAWDRALIPDIDSVVYQY